MSAEPLIFLEHNLAMFWTTILTMINTLQISALTMYYILNTLKANKQTKQQRYQVTEAHLQHLRGQTAYKLPYQTKENTLQTNNNIQQPNEETPLETQKNQYYQRIKALEKEIKILKREGEHLAKLNEEK